jgi:hypothetical protein
MRRGAAAVVALLAAGAAGAQDQVFYLPLPEAQLIQTLYAINTGVGTNPNVILRTTKIAVANNDTIIYYDQAENGYEANIVAPSSIYANPGNLDGTQIWGDGNAANGIPPGFSTDVLNSGSVIQLLNTSGFNGGDKFAVVGRAGVVMGAYPTNIGTVFAGGTEVVSTAAYGTEFRMPVGVNVTGSTPSGNDWELAEGYFLATQDSTTISLNGAAQGTINQGASLRLTGLNRGDRITATAPVGGMIVTGDIGSSYEMRWEAMLPVGQWTNDYVLAGINGDFTDGTYPKVQRVFLWAASATTVSYTFGNNTTGSITVNATNTLTQGATNWLNVPANNGVRFTSPAGTSFWGVSVIGEVIDDWGVPLVPTSLTTESIIIPEGVGCTGGACGQNTEGGYDLTADRSAVFVTPVAATSANITIYVDFDGLAGPRSPASYVVGGLDTVRLLDFDQDMTGALVYTLDGTRIVGVWGQFSTNSGDPYALDLGTIAAPADAILDYGDAPLSYGSASHRILAGLRLGDALDLDTAYVGNPAATVDDDQSNGGATYETASAQNNAGVGGTPANAVGACNGTWTGDIGNNDRLSLQFASSMSTGDWFRIRARSGDGDGADEAATLSFCSAANSGCAASTVALTVQDPDDEDPGPDRYYDFEVPTGVTNLGWLRIVRNSGALQVDCAATMKSPAVDDEDGAPRDGSGNLLISFPACPQTGSYTVNVRATNTSGAAASLVGFVDWTRDGDFDDNTNEESATVAVPNGTTNGLFAVTWSSVPANCGGTTSTYARFRLANAAGQAQAPTGFAATGEIEDFEVSAGTMPVTIAALAATRDGARVRFEWTTASEVGNVGFNIHGRTAAGTWQRLNAALIPTAGGGLEPQRYAVTLDVPAGITEFFVEDVDRVGHATGHRAFALLEGGAPAAAPAREESGGATDGPGDL